MKQPLIPADSTETGKPRVIPGASSRLLRFAAGAVPGLLARYMDSVIARAQCHI